MIVLTKCLHLQAICIIKIPEAGQRVGRPWQPWPPTFYGPVNSQLQQRELMKILFLGMLADNAGIRSKNIC